MEAAFRTYLLFTVSWFLHLTARIPSLGALRLDLLLILLISALIFMRRQPSTEDESSERDSKILLVTLIGYAVVTVPFVEWPGSVLNTGLRDFIKAVVFYFFTVSLVRTERKLRVFITVFLACQAFRVLEPVYLHLTEGYWGSMASLANWEYMDRLSGAPFDTVNPNGLAFIIDSLLPFVYFMALVSWRWAIPLLLFLPVLIYALVLTASRTGFIGMLVVIAGIWLKSKRKALLLCAFGAMFAAVLPFLSAEQQDRYLSIFRSDTKNAATAEGRIGGVSDSFRVAMRRPLFGHGLGTSREVNANYAHTDQPAHNLYAELAQEIGLIGLLIFLLYIKSIIRNFSKSIKSLRHISTENLFLTNVGQAMQVWFFMNLLFSFASYGLSSYEWYLLPGLSVVISRLTIASVAVNLMPSETITERKYVTHP